MGGALRVALTGGIATGKSHCLAAFATRGAAVIDADAVAREVVEPGAAGFGAVIGRFGHDVIDKSGKIDRDALGRLVFSDPAARQSLESIIHPLVYERLASWFDACGERVGVAEIPLLYETRREDAFDRVIVASCSPDEQRRRAMTRSGWSATQVEQRLAAQMPIEEKRRRADYVVDTGGTFIDTEHQIDTIWKQLTAEADARRA